MTARILCILETEAASEIEMGTELVQDDQPATELVLSFTTEKKKDDLIANFSVPSLRHRCSIGSCFFVSHMLIPLGITVQPRSS